jgi:hypothetical protein
MAICSAVSGGAENGNGGGFVVGVACSMMRPSEKSHVNCNVTCKCDCYMSCGLFSGWKCLFIMTNERDCYVLVWVVSAILGIFYF